MVPNTLSAQKKWVLLVMLDQPIHLGHDCPFVNEISGLEIPELDFPVSETLWLHTQFS